MKTQRKRDMSAANGADLTDQQRSASHLIRSAEKHLSDGWFDLALRQLNQARDLDPANPYIDAIVVRVQSLRNSQPTPTPGRDAAMESSRYLNVTVNKAYRSGIRPEERKDPDQIRLQIRQLTDTASVLLNRGLSESAFDSLMKAYLLDPMNPDVIACETRVLPAWEKARTARGQTPAGESRPDGMEAAKLQPLVKQPARMKLVRNLLGKG